MCDLHAFQFDVDKAYEDQLVTFLEASPEHPLSTPEARRQAGEYVLFVTVCWCMLDKPGSFVPGRDASEKSGMC